ncbi:hypothetical protein NECAME_05752 [Necator americanus]|uniref:Uncharacterized protein n=1 Tax=Necator americanus TaxID=51031 RepID=W2TY84_NECAM|nr:hypothetical protein NECAME_05752 [Necator americanus]ETN87030.1 hypothetical protein NECAME_05752 [Necator americanus]
MIQTLILSSANGFVTLYRHTVGIWNFFNPWIDHITKFSDIMLAFIYVMCIAFLNDAVRSEVLDLLCFRNKDTASPTIVTVCSKAPSKSSKKKKQKENTL